MDRPFARGRGRGRGGRGRGGAWNTGANGTPWNNTRHSNPGYRKNNTGSVGGRSTQWIRHHTPPALAEAPVSSFHPHHHSHYHHSGISAPLYPSSGPWMMHSGPPPPPLQANGVFFAGSGSLPAVSAVPTHSHVSHMVHSPLPAAVSVPDSFPGVQCNGGVVHSSLPVNAPAFVPKNQRPVNTYEEPVVSAAAGDSATPSTPTEASTPNSTKTNPDERFQEAARANHLNLQRALSAQKSVSSADYESSEEEDELNDDDIMGAMVKTYHGVSGSRSGGDELGSTKEWLLTSMKSKANVCLICIETIKRVQPIWSCIGCYSSFHIGCIQRWARDAAFQNSSFDEDNSSSGDVIWHCPKCRHDYKTYEVPSRYFCYCGRAEDPEQDPWLVPHSCGQICGRRLRPECGHSCLLLCHPGPCPPCPQMVRARCHCGSADAQVRRCSAREWSCAATCKKTLLCGTHVCNNVCHPGDCAPCTRTSQRPCRCGRQVGDAVPCVEPEWSCEQACGRVLSCGLHTCEETCHSGPCEPCPRSGPRTCPCGKSEFRLPCTEDTPTCVETCGKQLDCGIHSCTQRCHVGPCGTCRHMTQKTCRCGNRRREVQCYKQFVCDTKCPRMKECGKHTCKKKCCDGTCAPCEVPCNKTLGCRSHKCASVCHRGACYPCTLTVTISCSCGGTKIVVPCGAEKIAKPPTCKLLCSKPPDCHHLQRVRHYCHKDACPPCRQTCEKPLAGCEHRCPQPCHSAVLTKVQEQTVCYPCADARAAACGRKCGRLLGCTNHTCSLECHRVVGARDRDQAGTNCARCEGECERPRPDGCVHACGQPCHAGDCAPCTKLVRKRCHCTHVVKHIECCKWTEADEQGKQRLKCCGSICQRTLTCGHQCKSYCHAGDCPGPDRCTEKVRLRCPCKRRKDDFICNETRHVTMECDDVCVEIKEKKRQVQEDQERARRESEEARVQAERDEYEWKLAPRRRKPRRQKQTEDEPGWIHKYGYKVVVPTLLVLLAAFLYYLFKT